MHDGSPARRRLRAAAVEFAEAFADLAESVGSTQALARPERLLEYAQVARRLGEHVHEKTARRLGAAGAWPEIRDVDGLGVKVREKDLDAFIEGLTSRAQKVRSRLRAIG